MQKKPGYKIIKEIKGKKSANPNENAEVGIYIDTLPNGNRMIRVVGEHITEELKNELYKILGHKAKYLKVVAENCDLDLPTCEK
ncbi:MAG: hypothetical protein SA378_05270 [Sedimentibacter sp.]|uniref:hypothetical protein n=1 Tax=Sedimentibacter sp. TaxID=1960295 RepID=UPI002981ADE2|nr:hypothetical protein [Sedimentibacter sp.]MDW5299532.1 hypothetical protein [Sedimentibacter sp.]